VRVLADDGAELDAGESGAVVCKLPLPPGSLLTLWNADERFQQSYLSTFPGFYESGDAGYVDADGYLEIMSRTDDVINVAGHRLSTGAIEEVLATHPDVAECAVTGIVDSLKGHVPMGFLVLKAGVDRDDDVLVGESVALVRDQIGPVAAFRKALIIKRLPKTRSGKILRRILRNMVDGEEFTVPATIDDPAILDEIEDKLRQVGMVTP
jgi:propionyl-CoA synthetase